MSSTPYTGPGGPSATNPGFGSSSATKIDAPTVLYACGDCDEKTALQRGDIIMCKKCGHRVLYKMRTNKLVQFEAR
ncbi:metallothionein-I gene transcription activator [Aulographum hederae CBS 113979]|uniref:Metallothionein-I gene transcription activator n=1 Tax=Aulographum hederae CBS 113979 TaxID=1176131 RepID=A0A6G1GIQ6_9PEZI|nr:metallothionein-I gene transcription activator [Aulographum hederae CBS 113979]